MSFDGSKGLAVGVFCSQAARMRNYPFLARDKESYGSEPTNVGQTSFEPPSFEKLEQRPDLQYGSDLPDSRHRHGISPACARHG